MKIYLVYRTDKIDWDEHDSMVLIATSEKDAKEMAFFRAIGFTAENFNIEEIGIPNDEAIKKYYGNVLISSFNAG